VERWFAELTTRKLRASPTAASPPWKPSSAAGSTSGTPGGASPNSPPSTPSKPVEQITAGFDGDHWSAASEAVAYDMAGEVTGGPARVPESGTPA
jgi:hypothetical protein